MSFKRKVFTNDQNQLVYRSDVGKYTAVGRAQLDEDAVLAADFLLLDNVKTIGLLTQTSLGSEVDTVVANLLAQGASAAEVDLVADLSETVAAYTLSGAIPITVRMVELDHISTPVVMTMAAPPLNCLMFFTNTSASGTSAHTVTLTGGTFDGSGTIITLDAPGEMIGILFDSVGNGLVIANVGTVIVS